MYKTGSCKQGYKAGLIYDVLSAVAAPELCTNRFDSLSTALTCELRLRVVLSYVKVVECILNYLLCLNSVAFSFSRLEA